MKVIIIGPQCSGKTTIAQMLEEYDLRAPIIDEDTEINRRNGGVSPSDWTEWNYKWQKLRPEIQKDIIEMEGVIFFTSFFYPELIPIAKQKGFKLFQLEAKSEVLEERNKQRMKQGVDDAAYGWSINLPYHKELKEKGLVDAVIRTDKSLDEVCRSILTAMRFSFGMLTRPITAFSRTK